MTHLPRRFMLALAAAAILARALPADARETPQQLVDAATATLSAMLSDSRSQWLHANIGEAKAVLIAPRIVKAGFIIGGAGGRAVLVARGSDGRWAGPAFYNLTTGSIGFQAGYSEAEAVTLVMTQHALDRMMTGSFRMGGDLSVATGPVGGGANANLRADLITFTRARGIYGGVNMVGTGVSIDRDANAAFWGAPSVTPIQILVTRTVRPAPGAARLLNLLAYESTRR